MSDRGRSEAPEISRQMKIGLIGCGNMARALARGWGRPVLCADPLAERASALADETGGEALDSNADVAQRADLVILCHKPAQLEQVAGEVAAHARAVASILAATPLGRLRRAYPDRPVYRFLPSLPAEVRRGAIVQATGSGALADSDASTLPVSGREDGIEGLAEPHTQPDPITALFAELGTLVVLDDGLVDVAMGLMSCAPAYIALVAEAQVDAAVRRGLPSQQAAQLVTETLAGTAELLRARSHDTLALRREVASPGGTTARGLAALERGGVRAAFADALDAVLDR
jgi:pyrroline-5-carboxylate reductase